MNMTLGELRKLIAEEVNRAIVEAKDDDNDDDIDDGPSCQAIADDGDILLDDEKVDEKAESVLVPPNVQRSIRHYFQAMGLDGANVAHVRRK